MLGLKIYNKENVFLLGDEDVLIYVFYKKFSLCDYNYIFVS